VPPRELTELPKAQSNRRDLKRKETKKEGLEEKN